MRLRFVLAALLCAALSGGAVAQVEPRVVPGPFPTNGDPTFGGGIFPVFSGPNVVNASEVAGQVTLYELAGLVTFDLHWHSWYNDGVFKNDNTTATVIYTVDGKPVSPRVKAPYTWSWDSTSVPDGNHVVSIILVDVAGAAAPITYAPNASVIVVDNVPGPVLGDQLIPSLGGGIIRFRHQAALPEWLRWTTGYTLPHPTSTVPYVAPVIPSAASRNLPDGGLSLPMYVEPMMPANVTLEDTSNRIARTKTGHIFIDNYNPEKTKMADFSLAGVLAEPLMDGPRNDNNVSPYSTYEKHPTAQAFRGIDLGGRLFQLNFDGSVKTLTGRQVNRNIVPYSSNDPRVAETDRRANGQIKILGDFHGIEWNQPNDLATDPRNENIIYVADTNGGRVTKTDLSANPPDTIACASGFTGPASVAVKSDGTIFVADYDVGTISTIAPDCGAVKTIATGLDQPFSIRRDSHGNLIILELKAGALKRLDLTTNTVSLIAALNCNIGWNWLAVDRDGDIGPVDDMFTTCGPGEYAGWRVSADGTRIAGASFPFGHYPWAVAIAPGRIITHGFGDSQPIVHRIPGLDGPTQDNLDGYQRGQIDPLNRIAGWFDIWGAIPEFPIGAHPAQTAIRGYSGYSPLPNVTSYDDVATLTDDQIGAWITGGLGGSSPRPEIIGRDLQLSVQRIKQYSASFLNPSWPILPLPPTDVTPPIITAVQSVTIDGETARVNWTTDKPTLGYVRFGSSTNYFRWSDLERSFGTMHTATLPYLPENTTEHFMIVVEDRAGNFTGTPDHTVGTGPVPPLPIPTATLTVSPTSILAGQRATLTWGSTNAAACLGTGFTAGLPSGTAAVSPAITTPYSIICSGAGGASSVVNVILLVTQPLPPPPLPESLACTGAITSPTSFQINCGPPAVAK